MARLSPPLMSPTQTWVTQLQVPVGSFLAFILPLWPALNHYCSNTHLPFPHILLPDSYGNLLINLSTQFHWPVMTPTLPIKMAPRWRLHCLNQPHTIPALSCWNIIFPVLAPMNPYLLGRMWYQLTAFALHSMPDQIQTSSRHTLELSSTTMFTLTFAPSHHLNWLLVTDSLTNCHTTSHNHHINSALTPWCQPSLPHG